MSARRIDSRHTFWLISVAYSRVEFINESCFLAETCSHSQLSSGVEKKFIQTIFTSACPLIAVAISSYWDWEEKKEVMEIWWRRRRRRRKETRVPLKAVMLNITSRGKEAGEYKALAEICRKSNMTTYAFLWLFFEQIHSIVLCMNIQNKKVPPIYNTYSSMSASCCAYSNHLLRFIKIVHQRSHFHT